MEYFVTRIIPTIVLSITIYGAIEKVYNSKKEKRNRYLNMCVLYHRDIINKILDNIRIKNKNCNSVNVREIFTPLFDELKYYIHDMKFYDLRYKTNIYNLVFDEVLKCETVIYTELGNLEKSINKIKEIMLTSE